jgi:hypothetical protein
MLSDKQIGRPAFSQLGAKDDLDGKTAAACRTMF